MKLNSTFTGIFAQHTAQQEKCFRLKQKFSASDFAENCRATYMKTVRCGGRETCGGATNFYTQQTIINKIENKNNEKFIL